jgi:hypothetical protein
MNNLSERRALGLVKEERSTATGMLESDSGCAKKDYVHQSVAQRSESVAG